VPTLFLPPQPARGAPLFQALRRALAGVAALALALPAGAAVAARPASTLPVPPALQALVRSGKVKILSRFPTAVTGLAGYLVRYDGDTEVVYGERGYLFVGELVSPKNTDLNSRYRTRYAPAPDYGAVIRRLNRGGHLITEGPATAPRIYAIIDPNCSFCYRFYHMAEPLIGAGRLQVRWVLVGFLESTSRARAAAILTAVHPRLALRLDEDRFDVAHEHGGIAPARTISPLIAAVLKAHLDAMSDIGGTGTPTLMFRKPDGHWSIEIGLPPESWLAAYARRGRRR
jgi:thiol:disulfide interchange protein DsbG